MHRDRSFQVNKAKRKIKIAASHEKFELWRLRRFGDEGLEVWEVKENR
jgi:hypothetical protein